MRALVVPKPDRRQTQGFKTMLFFLLSPLPQILTVQQERGGIMKYGDISGAGLFSKWRL
jgi:hypothetical protein